MLLLPYGIPIAIGTIGYFLVLKRRCCHETSHFTQTATSYRSNEELHSESPPLRHDCVARNQPSAQVKLERACRPCRRNRQGAAVVEFAIVALCFSCWFSE